MRPYWLVVRNRHFLKLWGSQIFSQVAQNLLFFALIIRVFDLAEGTRYANVSVAMVVLAFGIPAIFFGPLAGVYVDYWNRKWVLVGANILRAGLVLLYPQVEASLWLVLGLSFLISAINQFFIPAESASIPRLVPKHLLVAANALFVFTVYASFVVGYTSAAFSIKLFGVQGPYLLAALLLGLATFLDLVLPSMPSILKRYQLAFRQEVARVWDEVRVNLRTILSSPRLSFPITQLTITYSIIGIILALAPALSLAVLKAPLTDSSHVLILPAGLGLITGVVLVNTLATRRSLLRIVLDGMVVAGVGLTLLGLTGLMYRHIGVLFPAKVATVSLVVALLVFTLGLFNAIISAAAQTMLQQATPDPKRGKVFGALGMMINIAATLPVFMAGILADVFSVTKVICFLGLVLFIFAVWQLWAVSRGGFCVKLLKNLDRISNLPHNRV